MISDVVIYSTVASLATMAGMALMPRLDKLIRKEIVAEPTSCDLRDYKVRDDLSKSLARLGVTGDADIRGGAVYPAAKLSNAPLLATVLESAASITHRLKNPAACSIYIRDSANDRFMLLGDLDLDHIREAASVIRRVADIAKQGK